MNLNCIFSSGFLVMEGRLLIFILDFDVNLTSFNTYVVKVINLSNCISSSCVIYCRQQDDLVCMVAT